MSHDTIARLRELHAKASYDFEQVSYHRLHHAMRNALPALLDVAEAARALDDSHVSDRLAAALARLDEVKT